jgi:hypothetical protein
MFLMRADPLRVQGQVGGGWALEFETFLGPVKCHRAVKRVPCFGAQKSRKEEKHERGTEWKDLNETSTGILEHSMEARHRAGTELPHRPASLARPGEVGKADTIERKKSKERGPE